MKRKKDRSGKVAVIASLTVILLVGVSVFSLYSLSGNNILESLGLTADTASGSAEKSGTGKLLTRYEEDAEYSQDEVFVADYTGGDPEDIGQGDLIEAGGAYEDAGVETAEDAALNDQSQKDPQEETAKEEAKTADEAERSTPLPVEEELVVQDSKVLEEVDLGLAKDVSGTAQEGSQRSASLQTTQERAEELLNAALEKEASDPAITDSAAQEVPEPEPVQEVNEDPEPVQEVSEDPEPVQEVSEDPESVQEVSGDPEPVQPVETGEEIVASENPPAQDPAPVQPAIQRFAAADTRAATVPVEAEAATEDQDEDGEWVFDYDTEEWVFTANAAAPAEEVADVSEEYTDNEPEDDGEWLFNEETEEWYYVAGAGAAAGGEEEDAGSEEGEWVFDYDTEEWYYIEGTGAAAGGDEEDTGTEEGEWVFDEETEEWYYKEGTEAASGGDEEDTGSEEGEWVFDEETEEWRYIEGAAGGDDDDSVTGEWLFDEETEEWYYVEYEDTEEQEDLTEGDGEPEDSGAADPAGEWVFDEEAEEWVYVISEDAEAAGGTEESAEEAAEVSLGQQIVDYAMGYVGVTPYVWAGNSLTSGTDCSGFVHLIYDQFGVYCSHASLAYDGSEFGHRVSFEELQPGDIVVYGGGDHVAIYAGNGYVVHCSSPRNGTVYWDMNYRSDISWFLRVL